jgi:hypothetical protein
MLLFVVRMYGETTERMLYKLYKWTYVEPPDVRYLLKYSLVNTWTYETAFGPLGKNHRTYTPLARRPLLFRPINTTYPLQVLHKLQSPPGCQSVSSVFCERWWSVCVFWNIREVELLRFCFMEVMFNP